MAYFPDGSLYEYDEMPFSLPSVRNIGWLSAVHAFPQGPTSTSFLESLKWCACNCSTQQMRGTHTCEFCDLDRIEFECRGRRAWYGSAEIWVPTEGGYFAAPNLIVHYVEQHQYSPPPAFVSAIISCCQGQTPLQDIGKKIVDEAWKQRADQ